MFYKNLKVAALVGLLVTGCSYFPQQPQPAPEPEIIIKQVPVPTAPKKKVMGYLEQTKIEGLPHIIKSKLDSGATTSSIDAEVVRVFEKEDREHILFRIGFGEGKTETFEAPVERWVRIKRKGGEEDYIRRPVVIMSLCLGGELITGEVNLADRGNFLYSMLIGRNMLDENILVDSSQKYTTSPNCES